MVPWESIIFSWWSYWKEILTTHLTIPLKKKWYLLCLEHVGVFFCVAQLGAQNGDRSSDLKWELLIGELFPELLNPSKSLKSVNHWFDFWFLLLPPLLFASKFWLNCHFKTTAIGCWLKTGDGGGSGESIQMLVCQWYAYSRLEESKQLRLGKHSIQTSRLGTLGRYDLYTHVLEIEHEVGFLVVNHRHWWFKSRARYFFLDGGGGRENNMPPRIPTKKTCGRWIAANKQINHQKIDTSPKKGPTNGQPSKRKRQNHLLKPINSWKGICYKAVSFPGWRSEYGRSKKNAKINFLHPFTQSFKGFSPLFPWGKLFHTGGVHSHFFAARLGGPAGASNGGLEMVEGRYGCW